MEPRNAHIMLDLETFGVDAGDIIWSIGAARFDPYSTDIIDSFEVHVDPVQALKLGFNVNMDTILWWMSDDRDDARREMMSHKDTWLDIGAALMEFQEWFGTESLPTWGNGATMDNALLRTYYQKLGLTAPWAFWDDRCYRTIKNTAPDIKIDRVGTYHSAVDDAISQALHMQRIVRETGLAVS